MSIKYEGHRRRARYSLPRVPTVRYTEEKDVWRNVERLSKTNPLTFYCSRLRRVTSSSMKSDRDRSDRATGHVFRMLVFTGFASLVYQLSLGDACMRDIGSRIHRTTPNRKLGYLFVFSFLFFCQARGRASRLRAHRNLLKSNE